MTIYTNVESDKLSKTGKYLFWIELSYNYPDDINLAFEDLQPRSNETFNEINVFLHDEAVNDFKSFNEYQSSNNGTTYFYYILVDKRNPRFSKCIKKIKESIFFQDCYQCSNIDSNFCIIRMSVISNLKINRFINSEYSKIYPEEELTLYTRNDLVLKRFLDRKKIIDEKGKLKNTSVYKQPMQVLLKNEYYYYQLISKYEITDEVTGKVISKLDDETKEQLLKNEYDSKINLINEIIDTRYV